MKKIIYSLLTLCTLAIVSSCKDASLSPYVDPESGVAGYGELKTGSFKETSYSSSKVDVAVQWISVDGKIDIDKIELYVNFLESYIDKDGNPAVAVHGGATGKTDASLVISGVGNRTPGTISIPASKIYDLYKDNKFKYDGKTETAVFGAKRPTDKRFLIGDSFTVSWRLYGKNGLVYKSWSPSTCVEVVGYNCSVSWKVQ
ncbi:MAG: hypothetical protein U0Y10_14830 [Spirosomataceae bacterium]